MEDAICPQCNKKFIKKRYWQMFCSSVCRYLKWNQIRITGYEAGEKISKGSIVKLVKGKLYMVKK